MELNVSHPDLGSIETAEDCSQAIQKLKNLRQELLKKSYTNGRGREKIGANSPSYDSPKITILHNGLNSQGESSIAFFKFFDELELIDVDSLGPFDFDFNNWLVKTESVEESDEKPYLDVDLQNIRLSLLHFVKQSLFDEKMKGRLNVSSEPVKVSNVSSTPAHMKDQGLLEVSQQYCDWSPAPSSRTSIGIGRALAQKNPSPASTISSAISPGLGIGTPLKTSSPIRFRSSISSNPGSNSSFTEANDLFEENSPYIITTPKNIDTRTYTRPKKNRTPLDGSLSKNSAINTLTISRRSPLAISDLNKNSNLNETFVKEDDVSSTLNSSVDSELNVSRKVERNLSYVIHQKDADTVRAREDLNSTYGCNDEAVSSPTDSNSSVHNISMEELHVMARLQEKALQNASPCRTLTRKNTQVILTDLSNIRGPSARPPARTSSTDTYCVGQSNPESPGSSGLSSPLDAQSYDDITAEGFRRSMPNLAPRGRLSTPSSGSGGLSLAPPLNNLRFKPHHISDTRLVQPSTNSRLTALKPYNNMGANKNTGPRDHSAKELRMNSNITSSATQVQRRIRTLPNSTYDASSAHSTTARGAGVHVPGPRLTSLPTNSQIGMPRPARTSFLPPPGFIQGSIRLQSRIPAPGSARGRTARPGTAGSAYPNKSAHESDWRDGCY